MPILSNIRDDATHPDRPIAENTATILSAIAQLKEAADKLEASARSRREEVVELQATLRCAIERDCDYLFLQIAQLLKAAKTCGMEGLVSDRLLRAIQSQQED